MSPGAPTASSRGAAKTGPPRNVFVPGPTPTGGQAKIGEVGSAWRQGARVAIRLRGGSLVGSGRRRDRRPASFTHSVGLGRPLDSRIVGLARAKRGQLIDADDA